MHKFSVLIIFLFIPVLAKAQFTLPRTQDELKNYYGEMEKISRQNINQKSNWRFQIVGGSVTSASNKESVIKYDNLGRVLEKIFINRLGQTETITVYKYNTANLPVLETTYYPDGTVIGRTKYTYDENNCISDITEYDQYDYIISKYVYETNVPEKSVTELLYVEKDSILKKTIYYYSDLKDGIINKVEYFEGPDKKLIIKEIIREGDKIIKEKFSDSRGKLYNLVYTYDTKGNNVMVEKELTGGSRIKHILNRYDEGGNIIGYSLFKDTGGIEEYYKFTFN